MRRLLATRRDPARRRLPGEPRSTRGERRGLAQPDAGARRAGLRAQPLLARADARDRRALARGARRGARPQVAGAGLGRPGPGPAAARLPPRASRSRGARTPRSTSSTRAGLVAAQRRGSQADVGPARRHPSTRSTGAWLNETRGRERGQRGARARHRRLRDREPERPGRRRWRGSRAEARSYYLLGYAPDQPRRRRPLPQDRGEAGAAGRRDRARAPRLLRARARTTRARGPRGATRRSSARSTRPSTSPACRCARSRRSSARRAPDKTRVLLTVEADIRGARVRREGRHRARHARDAAGGGAPRHRRVHALRPAVRDGVPAGDARALRARPGSRSRAS